MKMLHSKGYNLKYGPNVPGECSCGTIYPFSTRNQRKVHDKACMFYTQSVESAREKAELEEESDSDSLSGELSDDESNSDSISLGNNEAGDLFRVEKCVKPQPRPIDTKLSIKSLNSTVQVEEEKTYSPVKVRIT